MLLSLNFFHLVFLLVLMGILFQTWFTTGRGDQCLLPAGNKTFDLDAT